MTRRSFSRRNVTPRGPHVVVLGAVSHAQPRHASLAKTSRQNSKRGTVRGGAIASPSSRDRRYWHVALSRVSELRGPRMSLVNLTLSDGNISIFTSSPGSPSRENEKIERKVVARNFFIRYRAFGNDEAPRRDAKSVDKITLRRDCTRGKPKRNANDSLKRFNREMRYSRVRGFRQLRTLPCYC